jgi:hypothetical protein
MLEFILLSRFDLLKTARITNEVFDVLIFREISRKFINSDEQTDLQYE